MENPLVDHNGLSITVTPGAREKGAGLGKTEEPMLMHSFSI